MLRKVKLAAAKLRSEGIAGLLLALFRKVSPSRLRSFQGLLPYLDGKAGLEIGGPSAIFGSRGLLPAYVVADRVDNCNFSTETTWEGAVEAGSPFWFDKQHRPGRQYVAEARDLQFAPSDSYDFVLSSHMLEHSANPLAVLNEWRRLLRPGGMLLLVVPHRDGTFDHRRPVTLLSHLIEDFALGMTEEDLTHFPEILGSHDFARDPGAGNREDFIDRSLRNAYNRCLHHHAFDTRLAAAVVDYARFEIMAVEPVRPYHIVVAAIKPLGLDVPDNQAFLATDALYLRSSPFSKIGRAHV